MPTHRGEIVLPGGKVQPELDATPLHTALREAEEEVGIRPADVEVVAELDWITTVGSRFTIAPFVGLLPHRPALAPNPAEVVKVLVTPLAELLADHTFREELWDLGLPDRSIIFYDLPDETVWGATARILTGFLSRLLALRG
ncbi:MAG: CoA pyrophosphatase [Acidimicrobiia bacterium]|nr:CoA pyrophosphatase [Acidimicrobiia bacterium]